MRTLSLEIARTTCWLALTILACRPAGSGSASEPVAATEMAPEIAQINAPPDLDQLDLAVREQFAELWQQRQETPEVGAAWGVLGQWFDVYSYADSAQRCYRNAQLLEPYEPRWPYYLGRLAQDGGDLAGARAMYERAAQLAPGIAAPRVRLGDLWLQQQELEQAQSRYREVLELQPDNPGALLGIARLALLRGDAGAALQPLQALEEAQPEAAEVQYSLGLAWRQLGDQEQAIEHFGRVPEENSDQITLDQEIPWDDQLRRLDLGARTLTQRGIRAFRRGEHRTAVVLLGRAVAAEPEGSEKRINYGVALRETGHVRAAAEQLREALRLAPDDSELATKAHLELGRLLTPGSPGTAAQHFEAVLALDTNSIPAHLELGRIFHRRGQLPAALEHYEAVWRLQPSDVDGVRFWYAAVLSALGRYPEAARVLNDETQERSARLLRIRLLSAAPVAGLRDAARARRLLQQVEHRQVARSTPVDVLFAETAAMVAAEEVDFEEAIAWQLAAIATLEGVRPRSAAHTARRRLVLYQRGDACRTPWEVQEKLVRLPVESPIDAPAKTLEENAR